MVGKPYWVSYRLFRWAVDDWADLDGAFLAQGIDLARLCLESPSRFLNTVYAIVTRGMSESERAQLDFRLNQPPPWEDPETVSDAVAASEAAAFMAALNQKQA